MSQREERDVERSRRRWKDTLSRVHTTEGKSMTAVVPRSTLAASGKDETVLVQTQRKIAGLSNADVVQQEGMNGGGDVTVTLMKTELVEDKVVMRRGTESEDVLAARSRGEDVTLILRKRKGQGHLVVMQEVRSTYIVTITRTGLEAATDIRDTIVTVVVKPGTLCTTAWNDLYTVSSRMSTDNFVDLNIKLYTCTCLWYVLYTLYNHKIFPTCTFTDFCSKHYLWSLFYLINISIIYSSIEYTFSLCSIQLQFHS